MHGSGVDQPLLADIVLDTHGDGGQVALVLPHGLPLRDSLNRSLIGFKSHKGGRGNDEVEKWRERHRRELQNLIAKGRYSYSKVKAMSEALEHTAGQPLLVADAGATAEVRALKLHSGKSFTAFLVIRPPAGAKPGDRFQFRLLQRLHGGGVLGGCTYNVVMLDRRKHSKR